MSETSLICLLLFLIFFLFIRLTCAINNSMTCLIGKTALITGGNSGIGYQVALNLASRGCRVIIAARKNLEQIRNELISKTNNRNIQVKYLDLLSFKSIRKFTEDFNATNERLDILINNSGLGSAGVEVSEDDIHPVMQVNYFGPFLLTHLLINKLKESSPSRIVFMSSNLAYFSTGLKFEQLQHPTKFSSIKCLNNFFIYCNTKALEIIMADMFAEKLKIFNITSNSVHPGWVRTEIFSHFFNSVKWNVVGTVFNFILYITGKSLWEGAQTPVMVACDLDLATVTGEFFCDCRIFPKPFQTRNRQFCERIWKFSEDLTKLQPHEKLYYCLKACLIIVISLFTVFLFLGNIWWNNPSISL